MNIKHISDTIVSLFISLIITVLFRQRVEDLFNKGFSSLELVDMFFITLGLFILFTILIYFVINRTRFFVRRYIESNTFDYKYISYENTPSLKKFFKKIDRNSPDIFCLRKINPVWKYNDDLTENSNYLNPEDFFSKEYNCDFTVKCIKNAEKSNIKKVGLCKKIIDSIISLFFKKKKEERNPSKCIIQCSFIPVDINGNTILIQRELSFHVFIKELVEKKKQPFAFISFSPIPKKYEFEFNREEIYFREVPDKRNNKSEEFISPISIKDVGIIFRNDPEKEVLYIFYAFVVKYDCEFSKKNIKKIFALDANDKNVKYFEKDHDAIVGTISVFDLHRFYQQNVESKEKLSRRMKKILKRGKLLPVESTLLQEIVNKSSIFLK